MKVKISIIFILGVLHFLCFAQEITFKKIAVSDILSSGTIYTALQDRQGFLWFGTDYGLFRFDGTDFIVYRNDLDQPTSISDNNIWSLYEDRQGIIWVGTANGGLNRFDPVTEQFTSWTFSGNSDPIGPGLSDNSITSIMEDHDGILWIGTYKGGLNRFDPNSQSFYHWFKTPEKTYIQNPLYITCLFEDRFHNLWLGCYDGLYQAVRQGDSVYFRHWTHIPEDPYSLSGTPIWSLLESPADSGRGFWIGSYQGVDYFDISTEKFYRHTPPPVPGDPFSNSISSMEEQRINGNRIIWLASYGGLLRFDPLTGDFRRWRHQENDPTGLTSNQIIHVMLDRSGVLWITTNNGLHYFSPRWAKFKLWTADLTAKNIQDSKLKDINAFCTTSDGTLWIGANQGLFFLPKNSPGQFVKKYEKFSTNDVWSLCPGNSGDLWIGTYGNGLFQLDIASGKVRQWKQDPSLKEGLANNFIRSVHQDRYGMVWIGSWGRGLNRFDPIKNEWHLYLHDRNDSHSISYNDIWDIHEDRYGNIWIGTKGGGLNLYDRKKDRFWRWQHPQHLSHNGILTIMEANSIQTDSSTVLWVGTENGLNLLKIQFSDSIPIIQTISFSEKNGLPSNIIKSLIEDRHRQLWIGTNLGLVKMFENFDLSSLPFRTYQQYPEPVQAHSYSIKDGLSGNDFSVQAVCENSDGFLFWGTNEGMVSFAPEQLQELSYIPPVVITGIEVLNKPIPHKYFTASRNNVDQTPPLQLSYKQNSITFKFSALDFNAPEECRFQYKLEKLEREWINAGKRNFVSYTYLDPGKYLFRLKGSNSDGVWNETEVTFPFIISPPWWQTTWAYLAYLMAIIGILYAIRRYEINRVRLRHQLNLQTIETRKFQELEKLKSRFFANLSHEFRTPLMLITGPIEQLHSGSFKGNVKKTYELISRSSRRLMELIDQSLALSQLEAGVLALRAREENLIPLLKGLAYSFDSLAEKKGIQIKFDSDSEQCLAWIDHDKFEKIINNLLSNAIKFTPAGGKIDIRITTLSEAPASFLQKSRDDYIFISITDTGIGIPPEQQKKIFDRFYQVDNSLQRNVGGVGIGLALVKELVDLHHWHISVQSEPGKGSTFTLQIPRGRSHLNNSEIILEEQEIQKKQVEIQDQVESADAHAGSKEKDSIQIKSKEPASQHRPTILIVEDSADVRYYLSTILATEYKLLEATTGEEGLKKAMDAAPDLIISDIMMPVMDGIEFCRRLKSDINTSHIPIILLTARASHESRLEGLETGADDYLIKPFERRELLVRVKNLIDQRQRLKDKFKRELLVEPSTITVTSLDEEFLKKAIAVVEKNLSDPDFETEFFARELFVSRSQLHRKLTGLTGQTPGEFIRTIRLKRAAQLLQKQGATVSEVAYEVGFNNLSYFAKAFRRQFNCSPSEYLEKSE